MKAFAVVPMGLALVSALTACGRQAPGPQAMEPAADDSGYRSPPLLREAARATNGTVTLSGRALPGATVRLASPGGQLHEIVADASGGWSLTVPRTGPALYGLSQAEGERRDQAQGYVAVLPRGEPAAVLLRSGAGAMPLAGQAGRVQVLAVDFDDSGAAAVSGWAAPNQPLRLLVDGAPVDEGTAAANGRFSLGLPKPLAAGLRKVQVTAPNGAAAQVAVEVSPPPPFAGPLHAVVHGPDWRLDWLTPAGGVQSTVLFAPAEPKS